ncbi:ribosome biogenesis factor YjgA [Deltaproteobacteria bacterium TL4]
MDHQIKDRLGFPPEKSTPSDETQGCRELINNELILMNVYRRENMEDLDEDYVQKKSKSQKKREMKELQKIAEHLAEQSNSILKQTDLSASIKQEIESARSLKKMAYRRQIRYIGALLKEYESESGQSVQEGLGQETPGKSERFQLLEHWWKKLLEGAPSILDEILGNYPEIDIQKIRHLVRNSQKEEKENKPSKSPKVLLRYLQDFTGSR